MIRWPFTRKIEPVLPENVQASELPDLKMERRTERYGLRALREIHETIRISSQIREKLADGVLLNVRGKGQ